MVSNVLQKQISFLLCYDITENKKSLQLLPVKDNSGIKWLIIKLDPHTCIIPIHMMTKFGENLNTITVGQHQYRELLTELVTVDFQPITCCAS